MVGPELKGQIYGWDSDTWWDERPGRGDRVAEGGWPPRLVGSCGCGGEGGRGGNVFISLAGVRYALVVGVAPRG